MKAETISTIDAQTGEKITKCAIPDDYKKELDKVLGKHNENMNAFIMVSQQVSDLTNKWLELRKKITDSDNHFKEKMKYIAKKMKLGEYEPWIYNLTEKCFELREPPAPEPLTASDLAHANASSPSGGV